MQANQMTMKMKARLCLAVSTISQTKKQSSISKESIEHVALKGMKKPNAGPSLKIEARHR